MLIVTTWVWGDRYGRDYIAKLAASLRRNIEQPFKFGVIADDISRAAGIRNVDAVFPIRSVDRHLLSMKGCFARLRMFDPAWQAEHGIGPDDRLVCIDLDSVITGPLDPLFDRPEPFVILQKGNAANPCPYNGALMMLRGGAHPEVWRDFSTAAASQAPYYEFPDDQGWIWHKVPHAAGWVCGPDTGCYVYGKPGWPKGDALPDGARYVTFAAAKEPGKYTHLDWVRDNWRT